MQWSGKNTIDDSYNRIKDLDIKRVQIGRVSGRVAPDIDKMAIGEAREYNLAVLHIDVNGYKTLTNDLSNSQILRFLNTFLSEMTYIVKDYGGIVEKYVGDQVTVVFGIGEDADLAVRHSIDCALTMLTVIKYAINPYFSSIGLPSFSCSVGIDYGAVWMARTGVPTFTQFTLVGTEVSIASKLVEVAGTNEILIGGSVYENLPASGKQFCKAQAYPAGWIWTWRNKIRYPLFLYSADWKDYPV